MNKKRLLSAALLMLAFCSVAMAQMRLDILQSDKTITSIYLDDINYMEIVQGAQPGELDGIWYLGWRVSSSSTLKMQGEELLVFTAGKMKWIKKTSETLYSMTYPEGGVIPGSILKGFKEGSTSPTSFTVFAIEDDLLVLKQGTTRSYFYKSKKEAINAPALSEYLLRQQYADGAKLWASNIKGGYSGSTATPMGKHFEKFRAATEDDIAWLANPSNQPDASWHELGGSWVAKTITLYPFGSPVPADVNQHGIGDCCMCAVFASFAYIYPEWIKSIIHKDGNNYTVNMFDPKGNPIDVVVDNKMLDSQVTGKNGKFDWASIMEKALMKWETCFQCNKIGGIGTEHAAPPFTGNGKSYSFDWGDKLYSSEYRLIVDYALSNGMISVGGFHESGIMCGELETVTGHAFTVMYADEGADYSHVMRNPWGNGGYPLDGKLKIPMDHDILRLVDFRLVYPGEQMAEYKKENLNGYTPPRFRPMYMDMNPSDEMLRMYNVKDYKPIPIPAGKKLTDFVDEDE